MKLMAQVEVREFSKPLKITGYTFNDAPVLVVRLEDRGIVGSGEASGVYYNGETPTSMVRQIESVRSTLEGGISREALRKLLPPGGLRNALDCALWDLEAKQTGVPVWQLARLRRPVSLPTTFTVSAGSPEEMASTAVAYKYARAIKVKLTSTDAAACIRAVRAARPEVRLMVDANQGFTRETLEDLMPCLVEAGVALVEQPVRRGDDASLAGLCSPVPLAADESVQSLRDIETVAPYYDAINIKLDKCGGLTEGLLMADEAHARGLMAMVGCMNGTSLAMAPGFLLGQMCDFVDLDSPVLLKQDRRPSATYADGKIYCDESIWGGVLGVGFE